MCTSPGGRRGRPQIQLEVKPGDLRPRGQRTPTAVGTATTAVGWPLKGVGQLQIWRSFKGLKKDDAGTPCPSQRMHRGLVYGKYSHKELPRKSRRPVERNGQMFDGAVAEVRNHSTQNHSVLGLVRR